MIFDSEKQKQKVIDLIGEVPVVTNIQGIISGPSPEIRDLMSRLIQGHVMSVDEQTLLLMARERNSGAADLSDH